MSTSLGGPLRGFLADGDSGAGLGGLRVELWSANGRGPALIAAARSDEAGVFRMRLPEPTAGGYTPADVESRVLDRGTLLLSEFRPLPAVGRDEPIDLTVPPFLTESES